MADWDENSPSDSDFIAQYPANERAARAALVANFGVDHEANAQDANIGKHVKVSLVDQSSDPAGAAGSSTLYAKEASGASQLFWRSDTGAVVQLTAAGGLRAESLVGTVPDARLSSNVPLLNALNTFTNSFPIVASSGAPRFVSIATGASEDGKSWIFGGSSGSGIDRFTIATAADATPTTQVNEALNIYRSGTDVTEVELNADALDFNGDADISGTLAVGGAATFSNNVTVGGTITGNGSGLTNLNASNLSSGTVPDARLSSSVAFKSASNTFTANIPITARSGAPRFVSFVDGQPEDQGGWLFGGSAQGGNFRFLIATTADSAPSSVVNEAFVIRRNGTNVTEVELNADDIDINGDADISGTLAVGGAATFSNDVTVGGAATFSNDVTVGGTISGTISGNGSGLTDLNASNLSSGTVPSARLPATIGGNKTFSDNVTISGTITGNGSGLTSLNASNLSSGTVPGARLGGNQTMAGNKTFSDNVTINGAVRAGTAATSTSSTLAAGQIHHRSSNTTVPSMNAGQWVAVQNTSTSSITLSQGSGVTLELGGTTMTGNRTLLAKGFAFIYFRANGVGVVHGSGVT